MTTQLTYVPNFNHLFAASQGVARRRYSAGQRLWVNLVVYGFIALASGIAGFGGVMLHSTLLPDVPAPVPVLVLFAAVATVYGVFVRPWQLRRSAAFVAAARPPKPLRFTADDTGLRWQDEDIDFALRWSGVESMFATGEALCFLSGLIALVLPLSAFPDDAARRAFLADALTRLPPAIATIARSDRSIAALL